VKKFKEILVCVIGGTPQIVTETIYALASKLPPVYVEEIFIITTSAGRKQLENSLIKKGKLDELINEYSLPPIKLNPIVVIKDRDGNEIDDIRDSLQSEATADTIISVIRTLTKDASVRLHCCLAGGRKTMSFYLGSAMELFGRPWDKLYHVLVSSEFELNPEFFYKPKQEKLIQCRLPDGSTAEISTEKARIELIELPFIKFSGKIQLHGKSFEELIKETQTELDLALTQPAIQINLTERKIKINEVVFSMNPVLIALYAALLNQKTLCIKEGSCNNCHECWVSLLQLTEKPFVNKFVDFYSKAYKPALLDIEEIKEKLTKKLSPYTLRTYISKINRAIADAVSDENIVPLLSIKSLRRYGATTYGVPIDKRKIRVE